MDLDFDELLDEQLKRGKETKEETKEAEEVKTEQTQSDFDVTSELTQEKEMEEKKSDDLLDDFLETEKETKIEQQQTEKKQISQETDVIDSLMDSGTEFSFDAIAATSDIIEPDVAPPTGEKETNLIAGEKNDGKSALSFPGKIAVIAFDEKIFSARDFVIRKGIKREEDIMIYYPAKHYNPKAVDDREIGKAAISVVNDAFKAVYSIKVRAETGQFVPDWILFDNLEFFIRLAEFAGKYKRGVAITTRPSEGMDVWGAFDIRNIITNVIYKAAVSIPKKGIIYTLYTKEKDVILPDGTTKKAKVPKWFEVLMYETDNHIIVWKNESRYFAKIVGTKNDEKYPDGLELEITNIGFWKALESAVQSKNKGEVELF